MTSSPPGWHQDPDGNWHQDRPWVGPKPQFPDTSSWSRGKKLRVGLTMIGIAQIIGAVGGLIYTISESSRYGSFYPGAAAFGNAITDLCAAFIGLALIWIAREYVQE